MPQRSKTPVGLPSRPEEIDRVINAIRARLLGRYPRVVRSSDFIAMDEDEEAFVPDIPGFKPHRIEVPPVTEYVEVARERLNEIFATNELLCFRLLKHVYGPPDYTTLYINADEAKARPYDWGYCVQVHEIAVAEIRRVSHSIFLMLWISKNATEDEKQAASKLFGDFQKVLVDSLRRGKVLFDPSMECIGSDVSLAIFNPCFEKYSAAIELMGLAAYADHPQEWTQVRRSEDPPLHATGSVYLAAMTYFYITLEAFEGLIRNYFLKEDLRNTEPERQNRKLPLEARLATLGQFCTGFRAAPIADGSKLQKRLRLLRLVRNLVIHGEAAQELEVYGFVEDGLFFVYSPEQDEEHKAPSRSYIPVNRMSVRRNHAEYVKELVDEAIAAVIEGLQPEHMATARAFRYDALLSRLPDGRIGGKGRT